MTDIEQQRIEYKARLQMLFESYRREIWMDDSDWEKYFKHLLLGMGGKTLDQLVDELFIGIDNGYSADVQFELLEKIFKISGYGDKI